MAYECVRRFSLLSPESSEYNDRKLDESYKWDQFWVMSDEDNRTDLVNFIRMLIKTDEYFLLKVEYEADDWTNLTAISILLDWLEQLDDNSDIYMAHRSVDYIRSTIYADKNTIFKLKLSK